MAYDADIKVRISGEAGATVAQFVEEVTEVQADLKAQLNNSWAKVKAQLPADQQVAGETAVRVVLAA